MSNPIDTNIIGSTTNTAALPPDTPVKPSFKFTWSYSSLNVFDICPRKYWFEKVAKLAPPPSGEAMMRGQAVHKALELAARDGVPLPADMSHYKPILNNVLKLADIADKITYEEQLCTTADNKPTGWFDRDAYARAALDVFAIKGSLGVVIDYKTGKPPRGGGSGYQPVINAKIAFDCKPEIDTIKTNFVYLAHKKNDASTFTRDSIEHDFQPVADIIWQMKHAVETQHFPARKGFLCGNYCDDMSCHFNGRR